MMKQALVLLLGGVVGRVGATSVYMIQNGQCECVVAGGACSPTCVVLPQTAPPC